MKDKLEGEPEVQSGTDDAAELDKLLQQIYTLIEASPVESETGGWRSLQGQRRDLSSQY